MKCNMKLSLVCSPYPCAIWNYILCLQVQRIWQSQQDQSSSPSPAELTAMGIPWDTDTHKHLPSLFLRLWWGRAGKWHELVGAYWKQPELSGDALPPLCPDWDGAKVLFFLLFNRKQLSATLPHRYFHNRTRTFLTGTDLNFEDIPNFSLPQVYQQQWHPVLRAAPRHFCDFHPGHSSCQPAQQGLNQSWLLHGGRDTFSKHSPTLCSCACWLEGATKDRGQWSK